MAKGDSVGREMDTLLPDLAEAKRGGMLNIGQAAAATQAGLHVEQPGLAAPAPQRRRRAAR